MADHFHRADDEIRTRDPNLGKVMRYHCATSACRDAPSLYDFIQRVWILRTY